MRYCGADGLGGVSVTVGWDVNVAVGGGSVAVSVGGTGVGGTDVCEAVGVSGIVVIPGMGVRVGTFGTHSLCPV